MGSYVVFFRHYHRSHCQAVLYRWMVDAEGHCHRGKKGIVVFGLDLLERIDCGPSSFSISQADLCPFLNCFNNVKIGAFVDNEFSG